MMFLFTFTADWTAMFHVKIYLAYLSYLGSLGAGQLKRPQNKQPDGWMKNAMQLLGRTTFWSWGSECTVCRSVPAFVSVCLSVPNACVQPTNDSRRAATHSVAIVVIRIILYMNKECLLCFDKKVPGHTICCRNVPWSVMALIFVSVGLPLDAKKKDIKTTLWNMFLEKLKIAARSWIYLYYNYSDAILLFVPYYYVIMSPRNRFWEWVSRNVRFWSHRYISRPFYPLTFLLFLKKVPASYLEFLFPPFLAGACMPAHMTELSDCPLSKYSSSNN